MPSFGNSAASKPSDISSNKNSFDSRHSRHESKNDDRQQTTPSFLPGLQNISKISEHKHKSFGKFQHINPNETHILIYR